MTLHVDHVATWFSERIQALTDFMLEPGNDGWDFPAALNACGWWPPRGTTLKEFLAEPSLARRSFDIDARDGLTEVFPNASTWRCRRLLRHGDFRKQRTISTKHGSSTGREPATAVLFSSQEGFFRLLLQA